MTGAAHGDLSSEKVYVRFRTMTCAGPEPGTVVETEVAGFVAGSGKTGVRGPVVSREGALVEKAFLAGMVSGHRPGRRRRRSSPRPWPPAPAPTVANSTGWADIGRAGLGAGASSAGQKVADYMIRRAEQYQPVDPAPGRHEGDAGVPRRRPHRRTRTRANANRSAGEIGHEA